MMNRIGQVVLLLAAVSASSCGTGQRTVQNPTARDVRKAFADVSVSMPDVPAATELTRFDGLKGNFVRLVLKHDDPMLPQIAAAFGATGSATASTWSATVPSKTDRDWPWHFHLSITNADGQVLSVIEGTQPYD